MRLLKNLVNILFSLALVTGANGASAVEKVVYFHNDALGSPVAATDEQGRLLWTEAYEPYGKRVVNPGSDNKLWYTGKPEEAEFGLNYFGARWYDPLIGRFQEIDPVDFQEGNVQSFNRYAYANNNPYKYVDPDGQTSVLVGVVALGLTVWAVSDMLDMPDVPFDSGAVVSVSPEAGVFAGPTGRLGELAAKRILEKSARNVTKGETTVIGRVKDLQNLKQGENSLLDRLPDQGSPKANWKQNSGVLRQEMARGQPIRDAFPGDKRGQFLNAERNLLEDRGWKFDEKTNFWNPPAQ